MDELLSLSLTDLLERLRARSVSPVELMEAVLARIDATHADLNAVVAMHPRERLLAEAAQADTRIASGERRAMHGWSTEWEPTSTESSAATRRSWSTLIVAPPSPPSHPTGTKSVDGIPSSRRIGSAVSA